MIGRLGIIGAGNMGEAITRGVIKSGLLSPEQIVLTDISAQRLDVLRTQLHVGTVSSLESLVRGSDTIVLAVKPQVMDGVLAELKNLSPLQALIVSIAAGVPLERIGGALPEGTRVVRAMPNTPALCGAGVTALSPGPLATEDDVRAARALFEAVGRVVVVDETMMDAVTGLSGSGPAYVFVFLEALADGGVRMGLPRETAFALAVQTVLGAAVMASESSEHVGRLKDMVTSPGGTTIAGLHALERSGFRGAVMDAVQAATQRSRELGGR